MNDKVTMKDGAIVEPWQKMMEEWEKTQTDLKDTRIDTIQQRARPLGQDDSSYYSNNPVLDILQEFIQKFLDHNPQFNWQNSQDWHDLANTFPGSSELIQQMNELIKGNQALFEKTQPDTESDNPNDETCYSVSTLEEISNPYNWLKFSSSVHDITVKHSDAGSALLGASDIDDHIARAMDGWLELGEKTQDYYETLLKTWMSAYTRFLNKAGNESSENTPTSQQLISLWSNIANEELLQMHQSDDFLQTQQALMDASTIYHHYEQNIAEIICEALHIPTRQEVDDLHKTIADLREEIQELKHSKNI